MRNTQKRFPCLEQPPRCFIHCKTTDDAAAKNRRLCVYRNGRVVVSRQRGEREEFIVLSHPNENRVQLRNSKFDTLLSRVYNNETETFSVQSIQPEQDDSSTWWCLIPSESQKDDHENTFYIATTDNKDDEEMVLSYNDRGETTLVPMNQENTEETQNQSVLWTIEFVSGELCFISSPAMDKRLRCDMLGMLSLTPNWKGWEVWRLIETGSDGYVRISAWMHKNQYLCCDDQGKVYTTTKPLQEEGTKWAVSKSKTGDCDMTGVVIKSASTNRLLCFTTTLNARTNIESLILSTVEETEQDGAVHHPACAIWQLEAAHSQKYYLSCGSVDKTLGPFPYVTENKRQTDDWLVEQQLAAVDMDSDSDVPVVTLFSSNEQKYLCSSSSGNVYYIGADVDNDKDEDQPELWYMELKNDGSSYVFTSVQHNRILSFHDHHDDRGKLCTVLLEDDNENTNGRELWRLDPCMPRAVSSGKIKTFAIGTSVAVATTVAMPFAIAGVVGLMGTEVGVLGGMVAAGLTGAEAIASIGVVGTTAALVFRASKDSISAAAKDVTDENENSHSKRPFCEWRSW